MITHYDLFAGIGGFSLALEEIFHDQKIKHIFCEWESFPTAVLKRHWPDGEYWGDIADLVADTDNSRSRTPEHGSDTERSSGNEGREGQPQHRIDGQNSDATDTNSTGLERSREGQGTGHGGFSGGAGSDQEQNWTIVTGGFPCQPFSHAGRRMGTEDDRYQWPNMFSIIRNVKPEWVIAENVRGLVTWNEGMVLETVCADLEAEGYEVQPFIIPALAVGAPHRRDRIWIIGRRVDSDSQRIGHGLSEVQEANGKISERDDDAESGDTSGQPAADTTGQRDRGIASQECGTEEWVVEPNKRQGGAIRCEGQGRSRNAEYPDWDRSWQEVAFATCDDAVVDGLPRLVDGVPYSYPKWRRDSLKAYGNGIVHQVATEIVRSIKRCTIDNDE